MTEPQRELQPVGYYIRWLLLIFGYTCLLLNAFSWTMLATFDRWPWIIITVFLFMLAGDLGSKGKNGQFVFYYAAALMVAFWI